MSTSATTGEASPSNVASQQSRSTGSRQRGNRGGRQRNNNSNPGATGQHAATSRNRAVFRGNTEEMSGNVFECYEEQTDRRQFAKTIECLDAYSRKTLTYSADLKPLFATKMTTPIIERPVPPPVEKGLEEFNTMFFAEEVREFSRRKRALVGNLATIFAVAWGQCSEEMKLQLKTHDGYDASALSNDCVWLFMNIRSVTQQFQDSKDGFLSLLDAQHSFLGCKQSTTQSPDEFVENVVGWAETIEMHGGVLAANFKLIPEYDNSGKARSDDERKVLARERAIAAIIIRNSDATRYGTLVTDLANQKANGKDEYPRNTTSAKALLVTYRTPTNTTAPRTGQQRNQNGGNSNPTNITTSATTGTTLAQRGDTPVPGTDGRTQAGVTCFTCNQPGHMQGECPNGRPATASTSGITLLQHAFSLAQADHTGIDPDWILLDSQSTISVFRNANMLTNIRPSGRVLRAITNGGHQDSTMVGDFANLGEVWFNADSLANILSLADVRKVCRVTMDTLHEPTITVHRLDGTVMQFVEHASGLYIYKTKEPTNDHITGYTMLNTVAAQRKLFTRRQIADADTARELYRKLGRPSEADFISILKTGKILNCPVTSEDAQRATIIYGPELAAHKGKTTRSVAAPRAPTFVAVPIPPPLFSNTTVTSPYVPISSLSKGSRTSIPYLVTSVSAPATQLPTVPVPPSCASCATSLAATSRAALPCATYMGTRSSNVCALRCDPSQSTSSHPTAMSAKSSGPTAP
jgi:Zinc knuckle